MTSVTDLKVHRGCDEQGSHVWSPFVVKLEARLRFGNVPYTTGAGGPRGAPKGKIPYVEFQQPQAGEGLVKMGDSSLIAKHFVEGGVLPDLNGRLSPEDRARDLATRALLEEKLYFYHTRERWLDHFYVMRDHALSSMPWPIRVLVGQVIYRSHKAMLYGQGTLRLTDEEVRAVKTEIWDSINGVLVSARSRSRDAGSSSGDETSKWRPFWFLGGDEPTEVDTTLFGMIVSVLLSTAGDTIAAVIKSTRKCGNVALIGDFFFEPHSFPIGMLMEKTITLGGGQLMAQRYHPFLLDLVLQGKYDPSWMFTHEDDFENVSDCYPKFHEHKIPGVLKVLLTTEFGRHK